MTHNPGGDSCTLPVPWHEISGLEAATAWVDRHFADDLEAHSKRRAGELERIGRQGITQPLPMHAFGIIRAAIHLIEVAVTDPEPTPSATRAVGFLRLQCAAEIFVYRGLVHQNDTGESPQAIQAQYDPNTYKWSSLLGTLRAFRREMEGAGRAAELQSYRDHSVNPRASSDNRWIAATYASLITYRRIASAADHYVDYPDETIGNDPDAARFVRRIATTALLSESYCSLPPDKRAQLDRSVISGD